MQANKLIVTQTASSRARGLLPLAVLHRRTIPALRVVVQFCSSRRHNGMLSFVERRAQYDAHVCFLSRAQVAEFCYVFLSIR